MFGGWFLIIFGFLLMLFGIIVPPPFFLDHPPDHVLRLASLVIVGVGMIILAMGVSVMTLIEEVRRKDSVAVRKSEKLRGEI